MAKKCPPGVICIENMTVIFLISIVGLVFGVILLLLFTCGSFLLFKKFDFFGNKVECR